MVSILGHIWMPYTKWSNCTEIMVTEHPCDNKHKDTQTWFHRRCAVMCRLVWVIRREQGYVSAMRVTRVELTVLTAEYCWWHKIRLSLGRCGTGQRRGLEGLGAYIKLASLEPDEGDCMAGIPVIRGLGFVTVCFAGKLTFNRDNNISP